MVEKIGVSLNFAKLVDGNLSIFSGGVIDGLTAEAATFKQLPVTVEQLKELKGLFDQALAATTDAGPSATVVKNMAREKLIDGLRDDALYVEIAAKNDLALILRAGYQGTSPNRAQTPLEQVEVRKVATPKTGELQVRVKVQPNAKAYVGRIKALGGEFGPSLAFANSKKIIFKGLTAGVTYIFQLCAIGGSTGQSDWSDPVTKMAM